MPHSSRNGGRQIVFVASSDGRSRLWLRLLATTTAQPPTGTEGATYSFWAPDGRSIGFFADGALKRLDLGGGAARTLAPATNGTGGTWNAGGVVVFSPTITTPLMRVPAAGRRRLAQMLQRRNSERSGHDHSRGRDHPRQPSAGRR